MERIREKAGRERRGVLSREVAGEGRRKFAVPYCLGPGWGLLTSPNMVSYFWNPRRDTPSGSNAPIIQLRPFQFSLSSSYIQRVHKHPVSPSLRAVPSSHFTSSPSPCTVTALNTVAFTCQTMSVAPIAISTRNQLFHRSVLAAPVFTPSLIEPTRDTSVSAQSSSELDS